MLVPSLLALAGFAVVAVALWRDEPTEPRDPAQAWTPPWSPLPEPVELGRLQMPLSLPGYAPAVVDRAFDELARAYAELYAVAPETVRERARQRLALRDGGPAGEGPAAVTPPDGEPGAAAAPAVAQVPPPEAGLGDENQALAATAVLAALEERQMREQR